MEPLLSIGEVLGKRNPDSPLDGLGMLFPNGTPARQIEVVREPLPQAQRSNMTMQQFMSGFYDLAVGPNIVSRTEAWRNPYVRRCVEATAQTIAGLPFVVYNGEAKQKKHWWLDFVQNPNEVLQLSEHDLKEQTVAIRELFGETFWFLERGGTPTLSGKKAPITAVWIYHPHAVTEALNHSTGEQLGWVFQFESSRFFVDREDVVHFRRYDPMKHNPRRPSRGSSPLDAALLSVSMDVAATKFNLDFFSRGFAPGVILLTKDNVLADAGAAQQLGEKLRASHAGKNHGIAILQGDEVASVVQLSSSQKDAEFPNAKALAQKEVLATFGVPPCVGGNQDQKYDNAEMQLLLWWDGPLATIRSNFCTAINNGPLKKERGVTCDLDTRGVYVLRQRNLAAIDKYLGLVNARHSPKVASEMVGIDVDSSMPGFSKVFLSFSQIPYEYAEEGQSVSISKADTPDLTAGAPVPPADPNAPTVTAPPVATTPAAQIEQKSQRKVRLYVPDPPKVSDRRLLLASELRAGKSESELLDELLDIIGKDTAKLKAKAAQVQTQAFRAGAEQIANSLDSEQVIEIDDPRVTAFLEERGNLIESVPETVAAKINDKVIALMDQGTSPEDIGKVLRGDFNELSDYQARLIARQEVGSALNGGRFEQMQEEELEAREWMSSRDGNVRESHEAVDGEVVEGFEEKYSNGLLYPQDPNGDASEVINCRCIEMPSIGTDARSRRVALYMQRLASVEIRAARADAERKIAEVLKRARVSQVSLLSADQQRLVAKLRADGEIDPRTAYWRAVVLPKNIRIMERQLGEGIKSIFFGWRAPVLKMLAEKGIAK